MATSDESAISANSSINPSLAAVDDQSVAYVTNRWSFHVVQPILIACLSTSLLAAIVVVIQFVISDEALLRTVPLLFLITLEGIYTNRWLAQPHQRSLNRLAYRGAELMFIFISARLFSWIAFGNWPSLNLFLDYLRNPGLLLFEGHFIFTLVMTLLAWGLGIGYANLFADLAISEIEALHFLTPKNQRSEDNKPFQLNRSGLVQIFFTQWLWGGTILILLTAISTIDLPNAVSDFTLNVTRLGIKPAMLWALIIYFVSGFLLLSQGRLTAQTARWLRSGTTKTIEVERSWYRNSLRLVLITAVATAFIPIGSTTPISRLLSGVLGFVTALFAAILALFGALLSLLFPPSDQPVQVEPTPEPLPPVEPLPTPVFEEAPPPNEVVQYIFSSAFWAILIVLVIIALTFFIRERGIKLNLETAKAFWRKLLALLSGSWNRLSIQIGAIQHALSRQPNQNQKQDASVTNPFQFIRVNGLPPKEQIKYFYLSTLRRMEEKGLERKKGMTPSEFVDRLKEAFPEAEEEVDALTDAFLEARYSQKEFDNETVNPIKARWKKMRKNIRRKRSL